MYPSLTGSPAMISIAVPTTSPAGSVTTRSIQGSWPGRRTVTARKSSYGSRSRTDHSRKASSTRFQTAS